MHAHSNAVLRIVDVINWLTVDAAISMIPISKYHIVSVIGEHFKTAFGLNLRFLCLPTHKLVLACWQFSSLLRVRSWGVLDALSLLLRRRRAAEKNIRGPQTSEQSALSFRFPDFLCYGGGSCEVEAVSWSALSQPGHSLSDQHGEDFHSVQCSRGWIQRFCDAKNDWMRWTGLHRGLLRNRMSLGWNEYRTWKCFQT